MKIWWRSIEQKKRIILCILVYNFCFFNSAAFACKYIFCICSFFSFYLIEMNDNENDDDDDDEEKKRSSDGVYFRFSLCFFLF